MSDIENSSYEILSAATATGAGNSVELGSDIKAFQAKGNTTSGVGAATVIIQVTNNLNWPWLTAATLNLTLGTADTADGIVIQAGWKYVRANVTAISGTGASVSVNIGV